MNKHQYSAVATAILAICTSFAVWTSSVHKLPLPRFSESTVTLVKTIIDDFVSEFFQSDHIEVKEVTVQSLGSHFAKTVQSTNIQASVIANKTVEVAAPEEYVEPVQEPQPTPEPEESLQAAAPEQEPTDLEQWELLRAWSIAVPSLNIRAPVLLPSMKYWSQQAWDMLEEQMQIGLSHGTVAYPHSVNPGNKGSLIIAGHSSPPDTRAEESIYGSVFAKLPEVKIGEQIEVQTAGESVRYIVEAKDVVSPKATAILQQQADDSLLKLITCYPVGTTRNRMIITARKVEG